MKNSEKTKRLAFMAMFLAIEAVLVFTPLGFIPIPPLNPTLMHIPVIIAGITLGKKAGAQMGFVFGLCSFLNATFRPGVTSFIFTPFYSIGGVSGNWTSLIIAFIPRILLGFMAGWTYETLTDKKCNKHISVVISALIGAMTNTILVMGGIYVFFGQPYAQAIGISFDALVVAIMTVVTTNGLFEAVIGSVVSVAVCKALDPFVRKFQKPKKKAAINVNETLNETIA